MEWAGSLSGVGARLEGGVDHLHDEPLLSLGEPLDASGNVLHRYVPGNSVDDTLVWYEGSGLGTPNMLYTDEQGSVIATANSSSTSQYVYSPTGEPTNWSGVRFRYTGQAALPAIALYYYKARMYDPALGRFLQTDPVGYQAGMNLYAYVENNYTNAIDSSGLCEDGVTECLTVSAVRPPVSWQWNIWDKIGALADKIAIILPPVSPPQSPSGTNGNTPTPCDEADLSDYYDLWKFGGTAG